MIEEIWKSVPGFEDYEVSNYGRVRSLHYKNGNKVKVLKPFKDHQGYLHVNLRNNGKRWCVKVHRLVALLFIPNPENLPQINHITEDKTRNEVWNLEWCTAKYNSNYGTGIKRRVEQIEKTVVLKSPNGEKKEYKSYLDAALSIGVHPSSISRLVNKKRNAMSCKGYTYETVE